MTAPTTPLPAQILATISEHFGEPAVGAQAAELNAAIAKLISVAAQQQALRELWAHTL